MASSRLTTSVVCILALASFPVGAQTTPEASFEIIVHPDLEITSITKAELSKIFLKRLRTWESGLDARPVDQLPESDLRRAFSRTVHERSVVNIEVYWKRMIFSGKGVPPAELPSDDDVIEFVRTNPGAVGYVMASSDLEGVGQLNLDE